MRAKRCDAVTAPAPVREWSVSRAPRRESKARRAPGKGRERRGKEKARMHDQKRGTHAW